jgi:predicted restriction endonuclease
VQARRAGPSHIDLTPGLTTRACGSGCDCAATTAQAWGGRCAVTGCAVEALLEVAHVTPAAPTTAERLGDAMVLRADIHTLFDLGLMAFDDQCRVRVSPQLRHSEYWVYNGRAIQYPESAARAPCFP